MVHKESMFGFLIHVYSVFGIQSKDGKQISEQSAKTDSLGLTTGTKNETNALAVAAAAAAEAAKAAAYAALEVARLTGGITEARKSSYNGPIEQHSAAIKIQTAFRGYLVCVYVCKHHHCHHHSIFLGMYVCMHLCMYVYTYVCMLYMYVCVNVYVCMRVFIGAICLCICICE